LGCESANCDMCPQGWVYFGHSDLRKVIAACVELGHAVRPAGRRLGAWVWGRVGNCDHLSSSPRLSTTNAIFDAIRSPQKVSPMGGSGLVTVHSVGVSRDRGVR